jgi:hypothetical protein
MGPQQPPDPAVPSPQQVVTYLQNLHHLSTLEPTDGGISMDAYLSRAGLTPRQVALNPPDWGSYDHKTVKAHAAALNPSSGELHKIDMARTGLQQKSRSIQPHSQSWRSDSGAERRQRCV